MATTKIQLRNTEEDQTRELRPVFNSNEDIEFEGQANTHGILKEDLERRFGRYLNGGIGAAKIFKLQGIKDKLIQGGKFINPTPTFTAENPRPDRKRDTISKNVFMQFYECENISVKDLEFISHHSEVREATGYPSFHGSEEFEHAFEAVASKNIYLKNVKVKNIPGDLFYFRREILPRNSYITLIDCEVDVNGRQGVAWGDGENVYIDNLTVTASGRGGVDVEPPREQYAGKNIIIKNSYFNTWLLPFPMGGLGIIDGVLIENNTVETNSHITAVLGDRQSVIRKNIIFRGNKAIRYFGSTRGYYLLNGAENILIEDEETRISSRRSGIIAEINNCKNVVIRNNKWEGAKTIKVVDTPLDEINIYGNNTALKLEVHTYKMPFVEAPNIFEYKKTLNPSDAWEKWYFDRKEWNSYMDERRKTGTIETIDAPEYDVKKHGEPNVPKDPEFLPYMGVDAVIPEPPVVIEPEPVEEKPETTKEEPKEIKPFYKKKEVWFTAFVIILILLIIML